MKFALYDHGGKGLYLRQKLLSAGHELATDSNDFGDLQLMLMDCDWPWAFPRTEMILAAMERGAKVALYPHGGRPTVFVYDGIAEPSPDVSLRLEHGIGSVTMAKMFTDQDLKQKATGWLYCPTKDFEPVENPTRILFAPLHPNMEALHKGTNGHDPAPSLNQEIYRRLLELPDVELTVSLSGPAWRNGVWAHPKARFTDNPSMMFHHSYEQIVSHDVVVGAGTMGVAGVALGKPTVMFGQDSFVDYVDGEYRQAAHAHSYGAMVRYPLDTEDGSLSDLIATACEGTDGVSRWRGEWVGTDGTDNAVGWLEDLVDEPKNVVIQGVTARALSRS